MDPRSGGLRQHGQICLSVLGGLRPLTRFVSGLAPAPEPRAIRKPSPYNTGHAVARQQVLGEHLAQTTTVEEVHVEAGRSPDCVETGFFFRRFPVRFREHGGPAGRKQDTDAKKKNASSDCGLVGRKIGRNPGWPERCLRKHRTRRPPAVPHHHPSRCGGRRRLTSRVRPASTVTSPCGYQWAENPFPGRGRPPRKQPREELRSWRRSAPCLRGARGPPGRRWSALAPRGATRSQPGRLPDRGADQTDRKARGPIRGPVKDNRAEEPRSS